MSDAAPPAQAFLSLVRQQWLLLENLRAAWRRELRISAYEMQALTNVCTQPMTVGDLGRCLALTSGAMTGLADRLVNAGLVEKVSDPNDRRRVLLKATDQALTAIEELEQRCEAPLTALFDDLPSEHRAALTDYAKQSNQLFRDLINDMGSR